MIYALSLIAIVTSYIQEISKQNIFGGRTPEESSFNSNPFDKHANLGRHESAHGRTKPPSKLNESRIMLQVDVNRQLIQVPKKRKAAPQLSG